MLIKKLKERIEILYQKYMGTYEKKVEIPKEWLDPDYIPEVVEETPVAVEPTPVFFDVQKERKKSRKHVNLPLGFKRFTAGLLFIISFVTTLGYIYLAIFSSINLIAPAVFYFIPVTLILMDYFKMIKEKYKMKWYLLDDIE